MRVIEATLLIGDSSNVEQVSYNYATKKMTVKFYTLKNEEKFFGVYTYDQVPPEIFHEIPSVDSVGALINEKVKNKFFYQKVA